MKKILRIANIELSTMFYSPIAWFILVVFIIQAGMQYSDILERLIRTQEIYENKPKWFSPALTNDIFFQSFYSGKGLFLYIIEKLYLYIPLLTMGLISRETSSGTIKLLYSSPVKLRDLVLGKFTAMMGFSLLLVLLLAGFGIATAASIQSPDYGQILSGLLGIFLLLCAYSAIGLFMSSLTTHQIVAALGTFVVFALLDYIRTVWQDIDFVRALTYYLGISGRTQNMLAGLISTKDVMYFGLTISLFLIFTYFKLRATRESKPAMVRAAKYFGAFAVMVTLVYISSRPGLILYVDATANNQNTISLNSQAIIKKMTSGPIEITSYINLLDKTWPYGRLEERMKDHDRWEQYMRFKPDIKLDYVYYIDTSYGMNSPFIMDEGKTVSQLAEKYARLYKVNFNRFKAPDEIKKTIDLSKEQNRYVMHVKYNGRETFLRIFDDMMVFPSEMETMAAFKRITNNQFPRIGFLQGELEPDPGNSEGDRGYGLLAGEKVHRYALINQGFGVESISSDQEIPSNISCLVIAGPRISFSQQAQANVRRFIDRGGNLLIAGEPGKQHIMNPLLEPMGVQLKQGLLVQLTKNLEPEVVLSHYTKTSVGFSQAMANSAEDKDIIMMNGAAALTSQKTAFDIRPLLMTDSTKSWLKKGELTDTLTLGPTTDVGFIRTSAIYAGSKDQQENSPTVLFSEADGDEKGSFPTALALSRKINGKEQRIVVTGDADFLNNKSVRPYFLENTKSNNFAFGIELFGWLSQREYPIDTQLPLPKDKRLNLTEGQRSWMELFWVYILPGLVLIFVAVLLIRRRNK